MLPGWESGIPDPCSTPGKASGSKGRVCTPSSTLGKTSCHSAAGGGWHGGGGVAGSERVHDCPGVRGGTASFGSEPLVLEVLFQPATGNHLAWRQGRTSKHRQALALTTFKVCTTFSGFTERKNRAPLGRAHGVNSARVTVHLCDSTQATAALSRSLGSQ